MGEQESGFNSIRFNSSDRVYRRECVCVPIKRWQEFAAT